MSKILAVSDVHIHDYPQRNPSEKFRLYQSKTVAENIIKVGRQEGADIIVFAGDVLEKTINRPYVQAEVKQFLDKIMQNFREGYIIWGNHDQDNKSIFSDFTDSCLSVMLPNNLHYADCREVNIDNLRIGFYNWRPEFDLSWIDGKLDVLFTHATIAYSDTDRIHSQVLDETKFDLAICGDIHRPAQMGKYVSIGIPQRCKMSDSEKSTGVILDCSNKQFKWVNLNPDDNLMKFEYTTDRDSEGWNEKTGTYLVYKPSSISLSGSITNVNVPAWEEIDNLINGVITSNNLQQIHGEILKNIKDIESKEVDFNFVITRFYCKNWRSIDETELFLADLDKILVTGPNGSGKSSLLTALKYAFIENRNIKEFIQFGTKECMTEVDFLYQGNNYRITRGCILKGKSGAGYTKFYINGEEQKSNNKADLDNEIHLRFPFIDYMDVYFFDSSHPKLIGCITPERKSEIVSKFYKMDKIDAYHETAELAYKQVTQKALKWREEVDKGTELVKYLDSRLSVINLPELSKDDLVRKKSEGIELQKAWKSYNDYIAITANQQAQKEMLTKQLQEQEQRVVNFRDQDLIKTEMEQIKSAQDKLTDQINALVQVKSEGKRLYFELKDLDNKKVCPSCGQTLNNGEHMEKHKAELNNRIQELLNQQSNLYDQFTSTFQGITKEEIDGGCKTILESYRKDLTDRMVEINTIDQVTNEIQDLKNRLAQLDSQILSMGPIPAKVDLPQGFMETMAQIESDLSTWDQYSGLMSDRSSALSKIQDCQKELDRISNSAAELERYIGITGPTGKIYEEIMTRLATQFTDNRVKYEVIRTRRGKIEHLDLGSHYVNDGGNEVSYENCSDGQKTILDINFLSKVVTRMGLLVMDEFLKHLDAGNHEICIDLLSQMNIGCILLCSHMESVPAFNNKSIQLSLNESGMTKLICK